MFTEVIIRNNITNREAHFSAESYELNYEKHYIKIYHSDLGNVRVDLDENDTITFEKHKTIEEIIQEKVSACYHAYPDTLDDTVFCNAYGYSVGEGSAKCEDCPYKEKPILDKEVKDIIAYLKTGRYRMVNNRIVTENGYSIKRKGSV